MYQKILVPLDGSPFAEHVLPQLAPLIDPAHTELLLVQVVTPWRHHAYASPELISAFDPTVLLDRARAYLTGIEDELAAAGRRVRSVVVEGDVADTLVAVAEQEGVDLIAMTTHGRTGVARWMLGSIADRVSRSVTIPLYLVRQAATDGEQPIRRILVPLDGSELAQHALPHARALARESNATVVLLQSYEPVSEASYLWADIPTSELPIPFQRDEVTAYLERVSQLLTASGVACETQVVEGSPATSILEAADDGVDLIVMSTHGRSGVNRWLFGSVADKVRHVCPVPLLLVRSLAPAAAMETTDYEGALLR